MARDLGEQANRLGLLGELTQEAWEVVHAVHVAMGVKAWVDGGKDCVNWQQRPVVLTAVLMSILNEPVKSNMSPPLQFIK